MMPLVIGLSGPETGGGRSPHLQRSGARQSVSPLLGCMEWCWAQCPQTRLTMALGTMLARGRDACRRNGLLILSVLSVLVGCLLGFFLRTRRLSPQVSPSCLAHARAHPSPPPIHTHGAGAQNFPLWLPSKVWLWLKLQREPE